jgi:hypothetical protein
MPNLPPHLWANTKEIWTTWWSGELERPLVVFFPPEFKQNKKKLPAYPGWGESAIAMPLDRILSDQQALLQAANFPGDGWPRFWPDFGPGVVAAFLGATLHAAPDTVWFGEPPYPPLEAIDLRYNPDNIWWQRVLMLTRAAVARWGAAVQVAYTDLGGNLDVLASLRGTQNLLYDMMDQPELVAEKAAQLTPIMQRYFLELERVIADGSDENGRSAWAQIWAPGPTYMLQSDISYMISPEMFAQFVLPDLESWCDFLAYPFYHLDGKGQIRHLEMLLGIEKLRGIQWIPGDGAPPPEAWLPLLKRIRDGGKLCQVYVTAAGARKIARELGGRGFVFCLTEELSIGEANRLFAELVDG